MATTVGSREQSLRMCLIKEDGDKRVGGWAKWVKGNGRSRFPVME